MKIYKFGKIRDILIIAAVFAVTLLSIIPIGNLTIDGSIKAFMPDGEEVAVTNNLIEDEFGSIDPILVSMEINDETILQEEYLTVLKGVTSGIESIPLVLEVISPVNVDYIESSDSGISIVPLMSDSEGDMDISKIKDRILSWKDTYVGTVISRDTRLAQIIVRYADNISPDERNKLFNQVKSLVNEYEDPRWNISIAGRAVMEEEVSNYVAKDLLLILPLVALIVLIVFFISFRRWEGVLLPFIPLAVTVAWIVGGMAIFNMQITLVSFLVPILILVVGSAYSIHILSHFYEELFQNKEFVDSVEISKILKRSIREVRLSVILAGITTAVGFLSFFTSPLGPLRVFGLLCTIGVFVSLLVVFLIMPPMIRLRFSRGWTPSKSNVNMEVAGFKKGDFFRFLKWVVETKSGVLLILVIIFFLFAGFQIPHLQTGLNMIEAFKPSSKVFQDYEMMNTRMNGTGVVNILFESPERGDIVDSGFIRKIDKFSSYIKEDNPSVTSIQSISQFIKQINKVMNSDSIPYAKDSYEDVSIDFFSDSGNGFFSEESEDDQTIFSQEEAVFTDENSLLDNDGENYGSEQGLSYTQIAGLLKEALLNTETSDPSAEDLIRGFNIINNYAGAAYDEIPVDPAKYGLETEEDLNALLSQYLILGAGNLEMVINDDLEPDRTLITIQLNDESKETLGNVLTHIHTFWDREIPSGWSYSVGGSSTIYYILDKHILHSQYFSILGALFLVWLIITFIFRSARVGLIGLIPIIFSLGGLIIAFVVTGVKLDTVTSLTAAITIGVGADYAIHVLVAYRRLASKMDKKDILFQLYSTTGRAILLNALSVGIGFLALVLAHLIPIGVFGSMFALSMGISSLASLILIPAVLTRLDVEKLFKQNKKSILDKYLLEFRKRLKG